MLTHLIRTALRHLRRHKAYTAINVVGLSTGIAACILMLLYVRHELGFDAFHVNAERTFRLISTVTSSEGDRDFAGVMGPLAPALKAELPEVEATVRMRDRGGMGRFAAGPPERRFYEGDYLIAEESFFDVFSFVLLHGDKTKALAEAGTAVLTQSAAQKYFGSQDVVGKILNTDRLGDLHVSGLIQDPPDNSHLQFSMIISHASIASIPGWKRFIDSWESDGFITYVVLRSGTDPAFMGEKLNTMIASRRSALQPEVVKIRLQPMSDIHFGSTGIEFDRNSGKADRSSIAGFALIAGFVLVVAGINYVNLATARAMNRAREIGLRKVVGAGRRELVAQFLGESILLAVAATIVAAAAAEFALPAFNEITGKHLVFDVPGDTSFTLLLAGLAVLVGVVAGLYPAFYLASLDPLTTLSGKGSARRGRALLRHSLVMVQFGISVIMIVAMVAAGNQLEYIRTKNLGFEKDQVLVVDINSGGTRRSFEAIKAEMGRVPGIQSVSVSSRVPGDWKDLARVDVTGGGKPEVQPMTFIAIDSDFLRTYQIPMLTGRNLSETAGGDTAAVLVNETAARILGWEDPLHGEIAIPAEGFRARVIGVVRDFHFRSLHETIGPLVLGHWHNPIDAIDYFSLRVRPENSRELFASLDRIHRQFDQVTPLEWNFLDERIDDFYRNDRRIGVIFKLGAVLSIAVACLGLFGLMSFVTLQREQEIGIRKVLGAGMSDILLLLSKDFALPVLLGTLIASPIAYALVRSWLDGFAYRIELGAGVFLVSIGVSMAIALGTVSSQAVRAALANPVDAIRTE